MKIAICQLNPTIGDFKGNLAKMKKALSQANKEKADLAVFCELFITGYPPRDFLEKKEFIEKAEQANQEVIIFSKQYPQLGILFGNITTRKAKTGNQLYNSAILVHGGKIVFQQHKSCLPRRDVFDEPRYFEPTSEIKMCTFKKERLGISICADIWTGLQWLEQEYSSEPLKVLAKMKPSLFLNLSASPFYAGKEKIRFKILHDQAKKYKLPIFYVNQVGGNDELIFDGRSMVVNQKGELVDICPAFKEIVKIVDTTKFNQTMVYKPDLEMETIYQALILGLRDYVQKVGYKSVILGFSGGIDSSVTAALAAEALGSKNVFGVSMPSSYSSKGSKTDAQKLAKNLGAHLETVAIAKIYDAYLIALKKLFGKSDKVVVAQENIQARIRGNILMAYSNKNGYLVLSTGNKSELAVGYCTLYGDMSGGLGVLSDLPKNKVYELAHYINRNKEIIPKEVLEKKPSPELRPDQLTEKDLMPYQILNPIMEFYVEEKLSTKDIVKKGFDEKIVKWVIHKIDRNEFKRRQAAPGLKVTNKAFGMGRRMPIAAKFD
ncbi:MAG: NAD+ synthase [Patescibacteria group bacterium]|nr:NAD+ synthase [Patescibacteria group bacterium]MDD5164862.1 NAD+ synthase [Patescibacteria group bacterium]MDD5534937.1 NAD+ synthase [Patescibacteria group bacterium]